MPKLADAAGSLAVVAAMALPVAASATVGQGNVISTTFTASAKVLPTCSKLSVPNLSFGNEIPTSTGTGLLGFNPNQIGQYQALNTTNDCSAGASFGYSFTSANNCNLVGPNSGSLGYIIWDLYGNDVRSCSAGVTPPNSDETTWGNAVTF